MNEDQDNELIEDQQTQEKSKSKPIASNEVITEIKEALNQKRLLDSSSSPWKYCRKFPGKLF